MAAQSPSGRLITGIQLKHRGSSISNRYPEVRAYAKFSTSAFRASQEPPDDSRNNFEKQSGISLRKRADDSIVRAETLAPIPSKLREAKHVYRGEVVHSNDLWDDLGKLNQVLVDLTDSAKVVNTRRDLRCKAEEAKLITELAKRDSFNSQLFKQAYSASLDLDEYLDKYEISNLRKEPYDMEGACITIESRCGDIHSERWAGLLSDMYMKWAERHGHGGRIAEKSPSNTGGLKSATIELEFEFAYGYLSGERGVHSMIRHLDSIDVRSETASASVDVIPLFIESSPDLLINEEDLLVLYPCRTSSAVQIQHTPTGLIVQSTGKQSDDLVSVRHTYIVPPIVPFVLFSGERSRFANKMKAMNRMKSKLLVTQWELGLSSPESIKQGDVTARTEEIRRYVVGTSKMVQDLRSPGVHLPDVSGVLNGNLDPLIAAHLNSRTS